MRTRPLTPAVALAFSLGLFPAFPHARDDEIAARMTRQIDALVALMPAGGAKTPPAALADALIDGKARQQLFRLESLLRLYVRAHPGFDKYRLQVKLLEDGLGIYTFADDALSYARDKFAQDNKARPPDAARTREQERVLESLRTQRTDARAAFAKIVAKSTLAADLPKLRSLVVSRFAGWNASKEIGYVKGELQRMLGNVRDGRFNFNELEGSNGIHEFRRRLRWFPIAIDSLDGLVLLRDDPPGGCPVSALESLAGSAAAKHRYSNPALKYPATRSCSISRCLLWQVVKTTNDLGRIKDEALGNESIARALDNDIYGAVSPSVTRDEIARARVFRDELFASRTLEALMSQVSACKAQGEPLSASLRPPR
jgi:hypothetical protein